MSGSADAQARAGIFMRMTSTAPGAQGPSAASDNPVGSAADDNPLAIFWREVRRFGVIGVLGFVIDLGLFAWLTSEQGPLDHKVTTAKVISGTVATVFAWVGNRYFTFKHRENRPLHHEVLLFFLVNAVALAATSGWVALAHYGFGVTNGTWLIVHAVIGIAIGTVIRFIAYRLVVFGDDAEAPRRA